jgi:HSP20 family molecular chaperone IbpA
MSDRDTEKQETSLEKREATLPDGVERISEGREFVPPADIYETKDAVVVTADMPGVAAGSVDVTIEKNLLTIRGRVPASEPEGLGAVYREYEVGDFARTFSLSDGVDRDGITAAMKNGVLTLTLPKVGPTTKVIEVKSE